jgi:hypothetical protein
MVNYEQPRLTLPMWKGSLDPWLYNVVCFSLSVDVYSNFHQTLNVHMVHNYVFHPHKVNISGHLHRYVHLCPIPT